MSVDKNKEHLTYLNLLRSVRLDSIPAIDLSKALYLDSLYVLDLSWLKIIKALIRNCFFNIPELDIKIKGNSILMLTTIHARNDHDPYWNSIKALFPAYDEIIINDRFTIREYLEKISFRGITDRIKRYRKAYSALKVIEKKGHRSYLASKAVRCEKYINAVQDLVRNVKIVIAFCDTYLFENVMIQMMQSKGAVCITNQHGQPVFLGWDKDHLNQSQILNFSSDYFIAKGSFSKTQFVKAGFDEKKIIVLGSMNKSAYKPCIHHPQNLFGVFTDCILYDFADDTNRKLIEMAEAISGQLDMSYFIKVHPSDTSSAFHRFVSHRCIGIYKDEYTNEELFGKIEFGMISASAIYLDMLYANVKCYQLQTEISFPIVEPQADIFESREQFIDKYFSWKRLPIAEKEQYFAKQQREYGFCENTGQKIQDFVKSITDDLKCQENRK